MLQIWPCHTICSDSMSSTDGTKSFNFYELILIWLASWTLLTLRLNFPLKYEVVFTYFLVSVTTTSGSNPLFGGLKSTKSMFGRSSHAWIEGEGMLHAVYLDKDIDGMWTFRYNNRYVETETCKLEKQRDKPSFLPAIEGDSLAVLSVIC